MVRKPSKPNPKKGKGLDNKRKSEATRSSPRKVKKLKFTEPLPPDSDVETLPDIAKPKKAKKYTTAAAAAGHAPAAAAAEQPAPARALAPGEEQTAPHQEDHEEAQPVPPKDQPAHPEAEQPGHPEAEQPGHPEAEQPAHPEAEQPAHPGPPQEEPQEEPAHGDDQPARPAEGEVEGEVDSDGEEEAAPAAKGTRQTYRVQPAHETILFEWLAENDILWRRGNMDYRRTDIKNAMWTAKALEVGYTMQHLKKWWRGMTTLFGKIHKKKSGQAAQKFSDRQQLILAKMRFYEPEVKHRFPQPLRAMSLMPSSQPASSQPASSQPASSQPAAGTSSQPRSSASGSQQAPAPLSDLEVEQDSDHLGRLEQQAAESFPRSSGSRSRARTQRQEDHAFMKDMRDCMQTNTELLGQLLHEKPVSGREAFIQYVAQTLRGMPDHQFAQVQPSITAILQGQTPAPAPPPTTGPYEFTIPLQQPMQQAPQRIGMTPRATSSRAAPAAPAAPTLLEQQQILAQLVAGIDGSTAVPVRPLTSVNRRLISSPSAAVGSAAQASTGLGDLSLSGLYPSGGLNETLNLSGFADLGFINQLNTPNVPRPQSTQAQVVQLSLPTTTTTDSLVVFRQDAGRDTVVDAVETVSISSSSGPAVSPNHHDH